jgi:tape measure domain-containing protein
VADSLGNAVLTLSVDDRQYNAGLQRAKQTAEKTLGTVGGPNLGAGLTAITGGLTAAAVGAAAVGAAVVGIGFAATQSAGKIQQLQAAFTGLTGSAEAAAKLRQQLFDLSKTTPFKNEEILQASQRFLAVGVNVESLNGTINRVGSLAAQAGQPLERLALIYAQVYAKGRLQGEENLQLLEAGVDLSQELAQVTGLTGSALQDAMSKGQIGIDAFNKALVLATGDMKALQLAGKAVDVQFNNIGDNLGQLFGGFAQAISPALSAAFKVINDIFETAFPDLNSIVDFFAPLTKEAQRFADVLGSSPGVIEVVAAGLKSLGGVIIQNIADGISFVSDLLANVDSKKFIQGFIDAELVVRRLFLASSALGAQLVKNAELSARAVSNPLQFGRDIAEAGGFGEFIEKEYKTVERKWNDWANSEPLKFPDLTGKGSNQVAGIAGDLSNKTGQLKGALVQGAEALKKAAEDSAVKFIDASRQLLDARLKLSETQGSPQGLNRFLARDEVFTRTRAAITKLGPELEAALKRGADLLRSQGVGTGRPLFENIREIFSQARTGSFASFDGLQQITQFINDVNAEADAIAGVNSAQDQVNAINKELVGVNTSLRDQITALVSKAWNVQVNVDSSGQSTVYGDVVNTALSPA